jgi:hypothetical protein
MYENREYTVALALSSKLDLWVIWMYRKLNVRPSDISALLNIKKNVVKHIVIEKIKRVDLTLIDNPKTFKYLINLPNLYMSDGTHYKCILCNRWYKRKHLTRHLLEIHKEYVSCFIVGLGNGV